MASKDCKILSFKIPINGTTYNGVVDEVARTVAISVPFGTSIKGLTPIVAVSTGATVSPANGASASFEKPVVYTVTAEDGATKKSYTVYVTVRPDATVLKVHTFNAIGWSNVRTVIGNLASYTAGGIDLKLGFFHPKFVLGIQVDKGYIGYYDLNTKKLRVYKSTGVEASADETVEYSVVLMGE